MQKLWKSLLLATPATVVGVVAAQAADLPAYKSAPVEYVRVCDAYGAGFFYIPGTDTCLRVGGYVRFETRFVPGENVVNVGTGAISQIAGSQDETGMEVRGRIDVDARTQTQWGTVQTVVHLRGTNSDGVYSVAGGGNFQTAYAPGGNKSSTLTMERAFIRFAGLTAGVSSENFTTLPAYMYGSGDHAGFPNGIKQLAYTATFGNGFSATLAIESDGDFYGDAVTAGDGALNGAVPYAYNTTYTNRWDSGYALVGNVRYDQKWGFIQLAGAVTENAINAVTLGGGGSASFYSPLDGQTGLTGWALGGSIGYDLPILSPGDQIHLEGTYAHGFLGLIYSNGSQNNLSNSSGTGRWLGGVQAIASNVIATSAAGGLVTSVAEPNAWQIEGIFTHYWAPQWRSNLDAGYSTILEPGVAPSAGVQLGDMQDFHTGVNLIWSPVKNFDIGVEVDYQHLNTQIQNKTAAFVAAGSPGLTENGWAGILRIEREF